LTTGLVAGGSYRFRYRAANVYGWGPYSAEVTILAAEIPVTPTEITTTISDIYVKLSWDLPSERSSTIVEYEILIAATDGTTFTEETSHCEGSLAAVVSARYCHVPMATLRAAPFSLVYDQLIVAKIRARNAIGWSA
jgi:hypothetical protein